MNAKVKPSQDELKIALGKYEAVLKKVDEKIDLFKGFKEDMLEQYGKLTELNDIIRVQQQVVGLENNITQLENQRVELERQALEVKNDIYE